MLIKFHPKLIKRQVVVYRQLLADLGQEAAGKRIIEIFKGAPQWLLLFKEELKRQYAK
jgi:hypothetical protein